MTSGFPKGASHVSTFPVCEWFRADSRLPVWNRCSGRCPTAPACRENGSRSYRSMGNIREVDLQGRASTTLDNLCVWNGCAPDSALSFFTKWRCPTLHRGRTELKHGCDEFMLWNRCTANLLTLVCLRMNIDWQTSIPILDKPIASVALAQIPRFGLRLVQGPEWCPA